jgi:hypothetical protein
LRDVADGPLPLLSAEQIPLADAYRSVLASNAKWLRGFFAKALVSNGVSERRIADETGRDPSAITRMLSGEQALGADVVVAILARDTNGVILAGLSDRLGFEPPRRKTPDLAEENRRLREQLARLRSALAEEP